MRLRLLLLLPFALLAACGGGDEVVGAEPKLSAPERLDFGSVLVSSPVTRSIELRNEGRGATSVHVEVPAPFSVEEASFTVPGRSKRSLPFTFFSEEEGPARAVAVLRWKHGELEVELRAEAVESQVCPPSDDCRTVRFVPGQGCVEEWEPDGQPCERACLEEATCQKGVCVGVEKDCSDGDPCTADFCDPVRGCQNVEDPTRICPTDDPCKVPACNPEGGCLFEKVPDGTSCGPATCGLSLVCIDGECVQRQTPEGGACGEATPCQPRGFCENGECKQPSPSELPLQWSDGPSSGGSLYFDGVTSPDGRIYWVECSVSACTLASAHPLQGGQTLRRPIFHHLPSSRGRLLLSDGYLVSSYRRGHLEILRSTDLERERDLDLRELLPAEASVWEAVEIAAHRDLGFALVEAREGEKLVQGWAIAFSLASGTIEWTRPMEGHFEGLIVDENGRLYLGWLHREPDFGPPALVALSRGGQERWRMPIEFNAPLAVASGRLLDGDANIRRLEDGVVEDRLEALVPLYTRSAILDFNRGLFFGYPLRQCGPDGRLCPDWNPHLIGFDPWSGEGIRWLQPVPSSERWERAEPLLTDDDALLLVQMSDEPSAGEGCDRRYVLKEIRLEDGGPVPGFECRLPGAKQSYEGPTALFDGALVVANHCENRLEVYAVGEDRQTAERGWVTAWGNPGRAGTPR